MSKSEKELAFLRDLYISGTWTERFMDLIDKHLELPKKGALLYMNAGAANHALVLREKLKKDVELFCISESPELQKIAKAKVDAIKAEIDFITDKKAAKQTFDAVLANASLTAPKDLEAFVDKLSEYTKPGGAAAFFVPTAGSFGEIFSYLWEASLDEKAGGYGPEVEHLITDIPTVWKMEEYAAASGLTEIKSFTQIEVFEYENGREFIESPLIEYFLIPKWLEFLDEKKKKQASRKLAQIIDSERDGLSFRFSVKATLIAGIKA